MKMQDTDIRNIKIVGFNPLGRKKSIMLMILAAMFGIAMLFISFFLILIAIYVVIVLAVCGYGNKNNLGVPVNSQAYRKLQRKRKVILLVAVALPILAFFALILS